jgi:hypothetical protein
MMAEFHKNQIKWDAPERDRITLAKPDLSYLSNALNNLAQDSQYIADAERKRLDDRLAEDMKRQELETNDYIEDARSVTADFDKLGTDALGRFQATLSSYDEATQRRFLEANPHYLDNMQLAISDKILKRKRDIFENDVENNLPLWTSQAAMIGTEKARQDVIHRIQESLGNISYETTVTNMIFKANQMFDKYNVAELLRRGALGDTNALSQAEAFLKNPRRSVTIDPYQRVMYQSSIDGIRKDLAKEKKSKDNPQAEAIIEAYRKLRYYGFNKEGDYVYDQIINSQNELISTTQDGYAIEIEGQPMPLRFALQGLNASDRMEIAKEMRKYDNDTPEYVRHKLDYMNRVADLVSNYKVGHDNKDSTQSMAVAGLEEAMNNTRLFDELDTNTQQDIRRYVKQSRDAKTEIMSFDSTPFRDVGWFEENAQRVIPETTAGVYLKSATGPMWSPVPESQKGGNEILENLLGMSLIQKPQSGVQRDIYSAQALGNDMADYISYAETKGGDSLVNAVLPLRTMFYKDIEDNTIGEYVLLTWEAMSIMQKQGMLDGTRFYAEQGDYTKMFDSVIGALRADGSLNQRTTDENAQAVTNIIKSMAGRGAKLTEYENRVVAAIADAAAGSQVNRSAGWFGNWWNKNFGRDTRTIHIPDDATPSVEWRDLSTAVELEPSTKKTIKAAKQANDKMRK